MSFGSRSLPNPTAEQARRMSDIAHGNCMACRQMGEFNFPEVNHIVVANRRVSHDATYGLCSWHHRRVPLDGFTIWQMVARFGPSLLCGSRPFHAQFGSDAELLVMQNAALGDDRDFWASFESEGWNIFLRRRNG